MRVAGLHLPDTWKCGSWRRRRGRGRGRCNARPALRPRRRQCRRARRLAHAHAKSRIRNLTPPEQKQNPFIATIHTAAYK